MSLGASEGASRRSVQGWKESGGSETLGHCGVCTCLDNLAGWSVPVDLSGEKRVADGAINNHMCTRPNAAEHVEQETDKG
jgi:hypothetical protein